MKRRASTENLSGIAGFGIACELAQKEITTEPARIANLRDALLRGLQERIPEILINGHLTQRLPGNLNISVKHIEGESMLIHLDLCGVAASTGSACSSGSLEPSHVLLALGMTHELAHGSIRFSLGKTTSQQDISQVLEVFPPIVQKLRNMSPLYNQE